MASVCLECNSNGEKLLNCTLGLETGISLNKLSLEGAPSSSLVRCFMTGSPYFPPLSIIVFPFNILFRSDLAFNPTCVTHDLHRCYTWLHTTLASYALSLLLRTIFIFFTLKMFGFTHEQKTECKNSGIELCLYRKNRREWIYSKIWKYSSEIH